MGTDLGLLLNPVLKSLYVETEENGEEEDQEVLVPEDQVPHPQADDGDSHRDPHRSELHYNKTMI